MGNIKKYKEYNKVNEALNIKGLDAEMHNIDKLDDIIDEKRLELDKYVKERSKLNNKLSKEFNITEMISHIFNKVEEDMKNSEDNRDNSNNDILRFLKDKDEEYMEENGVNLSESLYDLFIEFKNKYAESKYGIITGILKPRRVWLLKIDDYGTDYVIELNDMEDIKNQYELLKLLMSSKYIIYLFNKKLFMKINEE